jgi:hypothetical protein
LISVYLTRAVHRQGGTVDLTSLDNLAALPFDASVTVPKRQVDQIDGPLLWRAWAEMEWEDGRPNVALKVLCAATGGGTVDLTSLDNLAALPFDASVTVPKRQVVSVIPTDRSCGARGPRWNGRTGDRMWR